MITWDPEADIIVPFGTLKSAAISEQRDPYTGTGPRPLFRVFDCVYLNDKDLTRFTLRDRRNALEKAIQNVHRRIEKHKKTVTEKPDDIEPRLREVVERGQEGLVLKNPRSVYRLNSRVDDWMKVKPEYMTEFGENLDCLIIGGYYGSGHRGGRLSSFMCGLRVDKNDIDGGKGRVSKLEGHTDLSVGANPMKFYSFFKVGGGFTAQDYANIKEHTNGKWVDWDRKNPPTQFIDVGNGEIPDVWIKPSDSLVIEVKAASVVESDAFQTRWSLRFPRFRKLRMDKNWHTALSAEEFVTLKVQAQTEKDRVMTVEGSRKRITKRLKKAMAIAGNDRKIRTPYAGPQTAVFEGLNFCVMSEMIHPAKKSKAEIEQIIKSNGGSIFQSPAVKEDMVVIGDKRVVKVASLMKAGHTNIVKPTWVLDAVKQSEIDGPQMQRLIIPFEPNHMFYATDDAKEIIQGSVDEYGDSHARDITKDELKRTFENMTHPENSMFSSSEFFTQLEEHGKEGFSERPGSMFRPCVIRFVPENVEDSKQELDLRITRFQFTFACGKVAEDDEDESITHFVVVDEKAVDVNGLRAMIARSARTRFPRVVRLKWIQESWAEKTLVDEEKHAV
jgi:DNA ligase-4